MDSNVTKLTAMLYSKVRPDEKQQARFDKFLKNKYGEDIVM